MADRAALKLSLNFHTEHLTLLLFVMEGGRRDLDLMLVELKHQTQSTRSLGLFALRSVSGRSRKILEFKCSFRYVLAGE